MNNNLNMKTKSIKGNQIERDHIHNQTNNILYGDKKKKNKNKIDKSQRQS